MALRPGGPLKRIALDAMGGDHGPRARSWPAPVEAVLDEWATVSVGAPGERLDIAGGHARSSRSSSRPRRLVCDQTTSPRRRGPPRRRRHDRAGGMIAAHGVQRNPHQGSSWPGEPCLGMTTGCRRRARPAHPHPEDDARREARSQLLPLRRPAAPASAAYPRRFSPKLSVPPHGRQVRSGRWIPLRRHWRGWLAHQLEWCKTGVLEPVI